VITSAHSEDLPPIDRKTKTRIRKAIEAWPQTAFDHCGQALR
jgi:hypothetical protein